MRRASSTDRQVLTTDQHVVTSTPVQKSSQRSRSKCGNCLRSCTSALFSGIGIATMLLVYIVGIAIVFRAVEGEGLGYTRDFSEDNDAVLSLGVQEQHQLRAAKEIRQTTVKHLWKITEELNILYKDNWTALANREIIKFQKELLSLGLAGSQANKRDMERNRVASDNRRSKDEGKMWTFASSFLYSLSLITTVGYSQKVPSSSTGKLVAIGSALLGIPLLLIYLTVVGDCLSRALAKIYSKLCCVNCCKKNESKSDAVSNSESALEIDLTSFPRKTSREAGSLGSRGSINGSDSWQRPQRGQHYKASEEGSDVVIFAGHHCRHCLREQLRCRRTGNHFSGRGIDKVAHRVPVWICVSLIVAYVGLGAVLFCNLHQWSFVDSLFFCFTILATIGLVQIPDPVYNERDVYSDPAEASSTTQITGLFVLSCTMYLLLGLALLSMCCNIVFWTITSSYGGILGGNICCSSPANSSSADEPMLTSTIEDEPS